MLSYFETLAWDERGATAMEYGLVVAVIALGLVVTMTDLRTNIGNAFSTIGGDLEYIAYMAIP